MSKVFTAGANLLTVTISPKAYFTWNGGEPEMETGLWFKISVALWRQSLSVSVLAPLSPAVGLLGEKHLTPRVNACFSFPVCARVVGFAVEHEDIHFIHFLRHYLVFQLSSVVALIGLDGAEFSFSLFRKQSL